MVRTWVLPGQIRWASSWGRTCPQLEPGAAWPDQAPASVSWLCPSKARQVSGMCKLVPACPGSAQESSRGRCWAAGIPAAQCCFSLFPSCGGVHAPGFWGGSLWQGPHCLACSFQWNHQRGLDPGPGLPARLFPLCFRVPVHDYIMDY